MRRPHPRNRYRTRDHNPPRPSGLLRHCCGKHDFRAAGKYHHLGSKQQDARPSSKDRHDECRYANPPDLGPRPLRRRHEPRGLHGECRHHRRAVGARGVTVSAMASVSADGEAPTLLVCVHHLSPAAPKILENGVVCVNVLREDQSYISEAFAGRFKDELGDKFECTEWVTLANGTPRVADPLVAFECRILSAERVGTHHVLLCAVDDTHSARIGSPLIYANRSYGSSRRIEAPRSMRGVLNGEGSSSMSAVSTPSARSSCPR
ncbi:flavin reductase family protein [Paracoccus cavernae]|uniref:Flavin reductase family protein n=1 Tax=Paracoccus cavernae TaxID=1571207 RepID=A0ABT8DD34_9RHOB|nr:flavin reductase family protein [Paracoccus cavernae]